MTLDCIKCLMFTKNKNIKTKRKETEKINLYSHFIDCGLKKFETIDEEELNGLLKV